MRKFKVVLLEHGYSSSHYERDQIESAGGEFIDADRLPLEEGLRYCQDADGILVRRAEITEEMIRSFKQAKILVRYGVGTDNVDVEAATQHNLMISNVPNYCSDEVSNHAAALLLAVVRGLCAAHESVRSGHWDVKRPCEVRRTRGKTLAIIGFGNIGQTMAMKMRGFGFRILAVDPFIEAKVFSEYAVEAVSLEEALRQADFVTLHTPLLPETYHLMNRHTFSLMKEGSVLINTARGGLVDTEALLDALNSDNISGAGLDVFEEEPLPLESPLRKHPRIVLSDHMAYYSEEAQIDLQTLVAREVVRVIEGGLPTSLANPQVLLRLNRVADWQPAIHMQWQLKRLAGLGLWPKD